MFRRGRVWLPIEPMATRLVASQKYTSVSSDLRRITPSGNLTPQQIGREFGFGLHIGSPNRLERCGDQRRTDSPSGSVRLDPSWLAPSHHSASFLTAAIGECSGSYIGIGDGRHLRGTTCPPQAAGRLCHPLLIEQTLLLPHLGAIPPKRQAPKS